MGCHVRVASGGCAANGEMLLLADFTVMKITVVGATPIEEEVC